MKGDPKIQGYGSGQVCSPHFVPGAKEDELTNTRVWDLAKSAGRLPILLRVRFSPGAKGGLSCHPAFHTGCPLLSTDPCGLAPGSLLLPVLTGWPPSHGGFSFLWGP